MSTMIEQLLSLASQINRSTSSRDDLDSASKTSPSAEEETKKILSLQQFIQVNESLLDSILLSTSHSKNGQMNDNSSSIGNSKPESGMRPMITISDIQRVFFPSAVTGSSSNLSGTLATTSGIMSSLDNEGGSSNHVADDSGIDIGTSSQNEKGPSNSDEIEMLIEQILQSIPTATDSQDHDEEMKICKSVLLSETNDLEKGCYSEEQILMVVQYLLRLSSSCSPSLLESTLVNITNITYPLLLSTPQFSTPLRDAIINATLSSWPTSLLSPINKNTSTPSKEILTSCLNLIEESISTMLHITIQDARKIKHLLRTSLPLPKWITTVIEFSCRLLSLILDLCLSIQRKDEDSCNLEKDFVEAILDSIHASAISIMTSLCYYGFATENVGRAGSNSKGPLLMNGRTSSLLRIVTSLSLPCLLEHGGGHDTERMISLWNFIHRLIQDDGKKDDNDDGIEMKKCRTWENTAPSVASGVLCIIAPNLSLLSLPYGENQVRLLQHPIFWNFIKNALNSESTIDVDSRGMKGGGTFLLRGGGGGGGTSLSNGNNGNPYLDDDNGMEDGNIGQLVRRRSIHILRLLIEKEYDDVSNTKQNNPHTGGYTYQQVQEVKSRITVWKKYILCFEALEMEEEAHLVDQVWDTVIELCAACNNPTDTAKIGSGENSMVLPPMSWDMVGSLFARVLLSDSPTLRKLGLFKLLTGRAGIALNDYITADNQSDGKKGKKSKKKAKKKAKIEPSPISIMSPSFVLLTVVPSLDSLSGPGFNFVDNGVTTNHDLSLLIGPFVTVYCRSLMKTPTRLNEFINMILSSGFITSIRVKTIVLIYEAVTDIWKTDGEESEKVKCTLSIEAISDTTQSLYRLFHTGSIVFDYQQALLLNFARILSNSVEFDSSKKPAPLKILETLILYVSTDENTKVTDEESQAAECLQSWVLQSFGEKWITMVSASCAAAFISGELIAFKSEAESSEDNLVLSTQREREVGAAISKLCALVGSLGATSASSLLWPAINKGLMNVSTDKDLNLTLSTTLSRKAARALILLESGCKECVLNGIGHGDLLVDKQGNMVPPPPNVELLLSRAINFLLQQLNRVSICDIESTKRDKNESTHIRSGSYLPNQFALIINQLSCLKRAYPSSIVTAALVADLLSKSLLFCTTQSDRSDDDDDIDSTAIVKNICLLYGTLVFADESLLEDLSKKNDLSQCCSILLGVNFAAPSSRKNLQGWQIKAMKSIFQHAKWGSLSLLLPVVFEKKTSSVSFYNKVIDTALDSVNATPAKGLLSLFGCTVTAAKRSFQNSDEKENVRKYTKNMTKVIDALFTIMEDTAHSATRAYMLQSTCSLLFSPQRLTEEYKIFQICIDEGVLLGDIILPIRSAFRKLINIAGTYKPYISKYALSYISAAWLDNGSGIGLSAIPYREDIAKLLIHKEAKLDATTSHKEGLVQDVELKQEGGFAILPTGTPDTSVARGFLLSFLAALPNVDEGLEKDVQTKICYYLTLWLLDEVCLHTQESGAVMVSGASHYCQVLRAWQTLCLLSRFVTTDISGLVSERIFKAMSSNLSGQIRYFIEIYTIQVTRRHPNIFGKELVKQIKRVDITQQYVCSMMIVAGNLIVGKYSNDFINSPKLEDFEVKEILAAVIPWLGSTLSFCRAIAQLLVHKLVPLVFPTIADDGESHPKHLDYFFVKNTWEFLDKNSEMCKLRQKQLRFFESYETDSVCTPEGIFGFPIDGVDESNPPYLVDALKRCLVDIGNENAAEAPEWKQMEELLQDMNIYDDGDDDDSNEEELVNFQRKILPLDTLNLTLENYKQQKRRNAAGRNRQSLIVCASLIEKVTNLGGITRTAEIFAAEKVLVPDAKIRKMDNFKTISVGAGEWIEIEELKENALLQWLKQRKRDGYKIVGVEQTSSSKCLSHARFEGKSVLLLGKEKEGIPQEFLNVVDQCVEIPQLGVIRSLNVHVSAAICMWEYTKQMMA